MDCVGHPSTLPYMSAVPGHLLRVLPPAARADPASPDKRKISTEGSEHGEVEDVHIPLPGPPLEPEVVDSPQVKLADS